MSAAADIVVAGGGHNSLITAAYLAKGGYKVTLAPHAGEAAATAAPSVTVQLPARTLSVTSGAGK